MIKGGHTNVNIFFVMIKYTYMFQQLFFLKYTIYNQSHIFFNKIRVKIDIFYAMNLNMYIHLLNNYRAMAFGVPWFRHWGG